MEIQKARTFVILSSVGLGAMFLAVECEAAARSLMPEDGLSDSFTVELEGEGHTMPWNNRLNSSQLLPSAGMVTFDHCNGKQQKILKQAVKDASVLVQSGLTLLEQGDFLERGNSPTYRKWFGHYSISNRDIVYYKMKKILSAINRNEYRFDCGCTERLVAKAIKAWPYQMIICRDYWPKKALGMDGFQSRNDNTRN